MEKESFDVILDKLIEDEIRVIKPDDPFFEQSVLADLIYPILIRRDAELPDFFRIIDGHCRTRVYRKARRKTIRAMLLDHNPSAEEVRAIQLQIDVHRTGLSDYERFEALKAIAAGSNEHRKELAARVNMDASTVTRLLTEGIPEVEEAFRNGLIQLNKRYHLARQTPELQLAQLPIARSGTLEDLKQAKIEAERKPPKPSNNSGKVPVLKLTMPDNKAVIIRGGVDLLTSKELLETALKDVEKAQAQGWTPKTLQRASTERSKVTPKPKRVKA